MSTLAIAEVQKALFNKLRSDGVLTAMIRGIFDAVPQRTSGSYVVIGDGSQKMLSTEPPQVTECSLDIHVWTEASGRKTAITILNRIYALMHLGTLMINGFQQVTLRAEEASVTLAEDGQRINGTLTVLATVAEL